VKLKNIFREIFQAKNFMTFYNSVYRTRVFVLFS